MRTEFYMKSFFYKIVYKLMLEKINLVIYLYALSPISMLSYLFP